MAESSRHIERLLPLGGPQQVGITTVTESGSAEALSYSGGSPGYQTKTITAVTESGSAEALSVSSGVLVHICHRRGGVHPFGGMSSQSGNFTTGTTAYENSRVMHVAHRDAHSIKLLFCNGASDTTVSGVGTITVRAGLEGPTGSIEQVLFSGADHIDLTVGQVVLSDLCTTTFDQDDTFWVRTNVSMTLGVKLPIFVLTDSPTGEGKNSGTGANSNLAWSGTIAASANKCFTAQAVLGNSDTPCVAVLGDSIDVGIAQGTPTGGYIGLSLSGEVPHVRMAIGGEAAYQFLARKSERQAIIDAIDFTDVMVGYVPNDIRDSRTEAQMKADLTSIFALFPDANVWAVTRPPYSITSTDGFTTVANQTADAGKDLKIKDMNQWRRDGADGGIHGYFDPAVTVEAEENPAVWACPGGNAIVSDGSHPNLAGCILMAAAVDPSVFGDPTSQTQSLTEVTELGEAQPLSYTATAQHITLNPVTESGEARELLVGQAHEMTLTPVTESGEALTMLKIHNMSLTPVTESGAAVALTYTGSDAGAGGFEQIISQLGMDKLIDEPEVYTLP